MGCDLCCPECKKVIDPCQCGEWDCGLLRHLRDDCPNGSGVEYAYKTYDAMYGQQPLQPTASRLNKVIADEPFVVNAEVCDEPQP
jgi:hypothetical protein